MIKVGNLFDVRYGVNLELNTLIQDPKGINFVSRTSKNNGVAAKVSRIEGLKPNPAGSISVAGGGSVMESFLQPEPYYSGRDLYYLVPKKDMSDVQKLFYCACLRSNKYRFNYGRQANRTLREISVPDLSEIPEWVAKADVGLFDGADVPAHPKEWINLNPSTWQAFKLSALFHLRKGKRLTKAQMLPGNVPFIGAIDSNNGVSNYVGQKPLHKGNTITVSYNGSVAEAFYQPVDFCATDDVNVLYPRFELNAARALFVATIIRQEKYRFNYGRKWHLERMGQSTIKLPVDGSGKPDWDFMELYINSLPYSSQIQ